VDVLASIKKSDQGPCVIRRRYTASLSLLLLALAVSACHEQAVRQDSGAEARAEQRRYQPVTVSHADSLANDNIYSMQVIAAPKVALMQAVGRKIFFDPAMSGSGKQSCASCHDPAYAYGPPNDLAAQPGGADLSLMGNRAVPSLRYKDRLPAFVEHFYDDDKPGAGDQGPTGGFGWDGKFSTLHSQAALPLMAPNEMANASPRDVVRKLRKASYAPLFRETFGAHALDDEASAFKWMTLALEYFQRDAKEFFPYSSKYDAVLRGQATLSADEQHGLEVFNDPLKGNCASCHTSKISIRGGLPQFSDYGVIAIGVPRNPQLTINHDPAFYDLGLCGPFRSGLEQQAAYCGAFRTPSLRNVALRKTFFHNGSFHSLKDVLEFYATRDTNPARWYPRIQSGPHRDEVDVYDDLPAAYKKNVNREVPFQPDTHGKARLTDAEIKDMIAFLNTLTDGYTVAQSGKVVARRP